MLALFLGLIALAIAILYSSAYDKIANEIRDIRAKCLRIDKMCSDIQNNNKVKNITTTQKIESEDNETNSDDPELEFKIPPLSLSTDYYENNNFKERFSSDDIIEEFI